MLAEPNDGRDAADLSMSESVIETEIARANPLARCYLGAAVPPTFKLGASQA